MRVDLHVQAPFLYLKPVQTGFPADSDAALVVSPISLLSLVGHMVPSCNSMSHGLQHAHSQGLSSRIILTLRLLHHQSFLCRKGRHHPASCAVVARQVDTVPGGRLLRPSYMLQAAACGASVRMGHHASEAAGCLSSEASTSGRTTDCGHAEVILQHAWSLPASPHLAVAAEGRAILLPARRAAAYSINCTTMQCGT